jgi:hypothetical protein
MKNSGVIIELPLKPENYKTPLQMSGKELSGQFNFAFLLV